MLNAEDKIANRPWDYNKVVVIDRLGAELYCCCLKKNTTKVHLEEVQLTKI